MCLIGCSETRTGELTDAHISEDPVDELAEDLSRFLHRGVVFCSTGTRNTNSVITK